MSLRGTKILVRGSNLSGKTALINRITKDVFLNSPGVTVQWLLNHVSSNVWPIAVSLCNISVQSRNGTTEKIQLWDILEYIFTSQIDSRLFRGAKAALLCYDLCDTNSFHKLKGFADHIGAVEQDCILFVCGCKKDVIDSGESQRAVPEGEARLFARDIKAKYFEISNKTPEGVAEMFQMICEDIFDSSPLANDSANNWIVLSDSKKEKSNVCQKR